MFEVSNKCASLDTINHREVEMKLILILMLASSTVFGATNQDLERKIDILADEIAALKASQSNIGSNQTAHGLGQAASKVYFINQGLSIGGYGEITYNLKDAEDEDNNGTDRDPQTEALRNIIYLGYKYNDKWILNTEIEIEHVNEVFTEFLYLDYLASEKLSYRFGLSLIPMGLTNELHEPIYFNSVNRPEVEKYLLPSTWRENGIGAFGKVGNFSYKAFLFNGPDGDAIAAKPSNGIRSGRKKGGANGKKDASTSLIVLNGNYALNTATSFGGSIAKGAGSSTSSEDLELTIAELHASYRNKALAVKFLASRADINNADDWNDANANKMAEVMDGFYIEASYDIEGTQGSVYTPFVRFSEYDLQKEFDEDVVANDRSLYRTNTVVGLAYKPIDRLVFKADYSYKHRGDDTGVNELNLGLGFVY